MSNETIKPGSIIKLDGTCKGDYMLARVKPSKFHLICIKEGNRLKEETIKESPEGLGITYAQLAAYLGPDYTFEVLYKGATPTLEAEPEPKEDLGDRGPEVTKTELERLACLAEEAGEIAQVVGKIIRHGYESYNPNDPKQTSNRILLETEIGDLIAIMDMMCDAKDLDFDNIEENINSKLKRVKKYLHHQK